MPKITPAMRAAVIAAVRTGRLRRQPGGYIAHGEYSQVYTARTVMACAHDGWLAEDVFDYVPTPAAVTEFGKVAA